MTPDLLNLARAATKLEGAPTFKWGHRSLTAGPALLRQADGLCWFSDGEPWTLDPTDPGTGGILLALLGCDMWRVEPTRDRFVAYTRMDIDHRAGLTETSCTYLAEACMRIALARGRW